MKNVLYLWAQEAKVGGYCNDHSQTSYEPCHEKTGLRGFRPGPTQNGLCSLSQRLET